MRAGRSSFSHLATKVDATALPTTLVALRPISSKWSTATIITRPCSGNPKYVSVDAITIREARGTPAIPLLVTIRMSSMAIC